MAANQCLEGGPNSNETPPHARSKRPRTTRKGRTRGRGCSLAACAKTRKNATKSAPKKKRKKRITLDPRRFPPKTAISKSVVRICRMRIRSNKFDSTYWYKSNTPGSTRQKKEQTRGMFFGKRRNQGGRFPPAAGRGSGGRGTRSGGIPEASTWGAAPPPLRLPSLYLVTASSAHAFPRSQRALIANTRLSVFFI